MQPLLIKKDEKDEKKDERKAKYFTKMLEIFIVMVYNNNEVVIMTLKELRKSKGLTQAECATYLGMTKRNYQNYENNEDMVTTAKYNAIYKKLEAYSAPSSIVVNSNVEEVEFKTNVVVGLGIKAFYNKVAKYGKRDCFRTLKKFVQGSFEGKICILYGLRRTGKTTLLFQMMGELLNEKVAYIKIQTSDNMSNLTKDLNRLYQLGYKYVFIDEITLMSDFINTAAVLSDIFSMMGMKIVVSGTDSLGFVMANRNELYDRNVMIHTSFISFKEYARLLKIQSVDSYIEYGGTLKMENMSFDDPDAAFDDVSFRDDESTRKYIDTAISRNIQHTLKNDNYGEYFNQLRELYEQNELTNVINRIVERMNHDFLLSVVEEKFKSRDFGSARDLLLHDAPAETAFVLNDVDYAKIIERLKAIIEIKEKDELKVKITDEHIKKVKAYLIALDLVVNIPLRLESAKDQDYYIFSQPGMRYSIAKALVYSLMQDEYFKSISEQDKSYIVKKILSDVKGRMLEDIVLLELNKSISKDKEVFQFRFDLGGEFDMVVYNKGEHSCKIYEIKHSSKAVIEQAKHLLNKQKCDIIESRYGKIIGRYVLYRGKDEIAGDIQYLNIEKFLSKL